MKRPIELFVFKTSSGDQKWHVTSRAHAYLASDGTTYQPAVMSADSIKSTGALDDSIFNISCAPDFPVLSLFQGGIPAEDITFELIREDEITKERKYLYRGNILSVQPIPSGASITCVSSLNASARNLLSCSYRAQCNHMLFSQGCGLSESAWRDELEVKAISGSGLEIEIDSSRSNGYYANGLLTINRYKRMITSHAGNKLKILGAIDALSVGSKIFVSKGCAKSYEACKQLNNEQNFWGFPHVPNANLFVNGFSAEEIE